MYPLFFCLIFLRRERKYVYKEKLSMKSDLFRVRIYVVIMNKK